MKREEENVVTALWKSRCNQGGFGLLLVPGSVNCDILRVESGAAPLPTEDHLSVEDCHEGKLLSVCLACPHVISRLAKYNLQVPESLKA